MEVNYKKKTKQLIAARTNNFIEIQLQKQVFFQQVIDALHDNLDPKQFSFLTEFLLFQQGSNLKRHKNQLFNSSKKKVQTQPTQRLFNILEIDPNIFHQESPLQNQFRFKKSSIKIKQKDINCTNTPRRVTQNIIFQNKKIYDLDKKLNQKYQISKNKILYQPQSLLLGNKSIQKSNHLFLRTSYQKTFIKRATKSNILRRFHTEAQQKKQNCLPLRQSLNYQNILKRQFGKTQRGFSGQNNHIPKKIVQQVLLSKRSNGPLQRHSDFSDFKLNSRYRECFN